MADESLTRILRHIERNQDKYVQNLGEALEIQSVSAWPQMRDQVVKMVHWIGKKLEELGTKVTYQPLGQEELPDGSFIDLPPVLLGQLGSDPKKKTLLIYGHLDVQPAAIEDGWNFEPFKMTRVEDKLYGRGATDDKGPVLGWIHALAAFQAENVDIPLNLKFCFEGMEESGSKGLSEFLSSREGLKFLDDTDYVCISDSYWLGKKKPCVTYGLRGNCHFFLEIRSTGRDLHSGVFGGTVHEALADLIAMLDTLVNEKGTILVPGIQDQVTPVTKEEVELYQGIDFDPIDYQKDIGAAVLIQGEDKVQTLMARWRFPSLSIHGIEGAFAEPGSKTVIPRRVIGKFSIRIVPNMEPDDVEHKVRTYLQQKWLERGSPNKMSLRLVHRTKSFLSDPNHPNYVAARRAIKQVFHVEPDLIREGCSIPVALTFQELTQKNLLLLPIGRCDDGAHSQDEKINIDNYIKGTQVMACYLKQLGSI